MLFRLFKDQHSLTWRRLALDWVLSFDITVSYSKFVNNGGHSLCDVLVQNLSELDISWQKEKKEKNGTKGFSLFWTALARVQLNTVEHCSSPWGNDMHQVSMLEPIESALLLPCSTGITNESKGLSRHLPSFFWMDLLLPNYLQYIGSFSIRYINNPVDLKSIPSNIF